MYWQEAAYFVLSSNPNERDFQQNPYLQYPFLLCITIVTFMKNPLILHNYRLGPSANLNPATMIDHDQYRIDHDQNPGSGGERLSLPV